MKYFDSRSFILVFFSIVIFGMVCVVGANVLVDPFYRFNLVTIRGVNVQRYQFSSNVRMGKAGAVCRVNPRTIIFGSSRAEIGLDPKHPGFEYGPVYNFAMPGTGVQEMRDMLRHAIYAAPHLKQAIIALDFFMFNAFREEVLYRTEVLDFDRNRLLDKSSDSCMKNFYYDAGRLVGFKGLRYVFETLRSQRNEIDKSTVDNLTQAYWWAALYDADGFRGKSYEVFKSLANNSGVKLLHKQDYQQEDYYVKKIWRAGSSHRYCFAKSGQTNTLDIFRDMLQLARQAGLDVTFVINPIHARMLVAIQEAGLWPQYEDWKRALVKIIADNASEHHAAPYALWDFSGFNTITMVDVPPPKTKTIAKWLWETSHYKRTTGDMMLDKVLGYKQAQTAIPANFGVLLNQTNIETWLAKNLNLSRIYMAAHKDEVDDLKNHLAKLYANWEGSNCGEDMQAVRDGSAALRRGDVKKAKALFARARVIYELNKERALKISVPYRELGFEHSLADAMAGKSIDVPLESWQDYQDRGNLRAGKMDFQGAIADYTKALIDSPPNPALYFLRGTTKMRLKEFKGAEQDFLAGLKIDPNNVVLKKLLAEANKAKLQNAKA